MCSEVRVFFTLWGGHPSLPFSEVRAILEAEGFNYKVVDELPQLLRCIVKPECVNAILSRASMTRTCCLELFECGDDVEEILRNVRDVDFESLLRGCRSYAIRVRRFQGSSTHIRSLKLERDIGDIVWSSLPIKVDLENPEVVLEGILTGGRFVFGKLLGEVSTKSFRSRRVELRPFPHPSAMQPILARCMVNLSRPKSGDTLLDPFCGSGSLLLEASLIGCRVIGVDAKRRMIEGCLRNLLHYGVKEFSLLVGDARKLPLFETDCISTDPPYGRSATTLKTPIGELLRDFLSEVVDRVSVDGCICLASPKHVGLSEVGRELGLKLVESHFMYVHKSLTREIAVFKK